MSNLSGATTAVFIISLSAALETPVTVAWQTKDGTAKAGTDYEAASGSVTFEPGETSKQVQVVVNGRSPGDTETRTFSIQLYPPENAILDQELTEVEIQVADSEGTAITSLVVATGPRGVKGDPGLSSYELAKLQGYEGTLEEYIQQETAAGIAADRAASEANRSDDAADRAERAADEAEAKADTELTFDNIDLGLAGTTNGQTFRVKQKDSEILFDYYTNAAGVAIYQGSAPSYLAISNMRQMLNNNDDFNSLHSFSDEDGHIGAKVQMDPYGIGFSSLAVKMMPKVIENLLGSLREGSSSDQGFILKDEDGHLLATFLDGVAKALGLTVSYDWQEEIVDIFSKTLALSASKFSLILDSGDDVIRLQDEDGFIFLRLTKDLELLSKIAGSGGGGSSGKDIIARLGTRSLNKITAAMRQRYYLTQMPTAEINVGLMVGQSHSHGTFSRVVLTVSQNLGNLMLGNSPRGTNYLNTTTSDQYGPVGGNILVNLIEVRQLDDGTVSASSGSFGETSLSGWLNFGKILHNQRLMTDNDTTRVFAGACPGVGGKSLAQLSKGANPNLYNHIITAMQGIKSAADAAGKTSRFCGVTFMQMENDGSTPYTTYYPQLEQFYSDVNTDGMAIFGQTRPPHWYFYQGGGMYTSDTNSMAASRALLDFCDNHPGLASFVNPIGQLPNPVNPDGNDNHLFANSYRWFGCDVGRVMDLVHRGSGRPVFRMREAVYKGNVATVSVSPPVPPFKFVPTYVGSVATMHADKGFTIRDGAGHLHGADLTVEAVSDTVISISASRDLVPPVQIWLGDKTYHSGTHNIADSDDSIAPYVWEIVAGAPAEESIAGLNGKPYELRNWCGADIINATEEL